jgi:trans-aconitate 2-methyltransferase
MMWDPKQYNKYFKERNRPAIDLINQIPENKYQSIIDLGCGDGVITNYLHNKYNPKHIVGLDSSSSMLEQAKQISYKIDWQLSNIGNFTGNYDLIFSNSALQWLDNHEKLFNHIISSTNSTIAIQMPNNFNSPSHTLLVDTILEYPKFKNKLITTIRQEPVHNKNFYYDILYKDLATIDIWETQYLHQLEGDNPILEWVRGTALVPIKSKLNPDEYQEFEDIYNQKLLSVYKPQTNGITLFPFNRIFILGTK